MGILVVVAVALVAVVATVVILSSGGPTETVRDYLNSITSDRPGSAFNDTVWSLDKNLYPLWKYGMEFETSKNATLDIHSLTEITKNDMTVGQREEMNVTADIIEHLFNVTVDDYCFVKFNITITVIEHGVKEIDNETGRFSLVKVNGSWLIVLSLDDLEEIISHESVTSAAAIVPP